MKTQMLGWTGVHLPLVGQGTWMLEKNREQALQALRTGITTGMTLIDTAEMYGDGEVEELVGEAVTNERDRVFIVSKVLPNNATYDGTRRACEQSLRRLHTDHIDLYLLHWPGNTPIAGTMRAMESLVAEKSIRYIGVSNFDVRDIQGAMRAMRNERLACNQVLYHLRDRGIERSIVPFCRQHEIAVMGYSPFGHRDFPTRSSTLSQIASAHRCSPRQVALAFLIRDGIYALPRSADPAHVRENASAADLTLDEADLSRIDRAFPAPKSDTPLGMI